MIDNAKGCPAFLKNKEEGREQPSSPSRHVHLASPPLPSRPIARPLRLLHLRSSPFHPARDPTLFRTSIPLSLSLRFLFSSTSAPSLTFRFATARILNRAYYLRAIIIPKTNSYFLLRNRKLINQSSRAGAPGFASLKKVARRPGGPRMRARACRQWTRVHLRDSNGRNFLWNFVIMGSLLARLARPKALALAPLCASPG